jgi:tRNA-specific 2-thiouridylase
MSRVAVAVSGGVDSLCALMLVRDQGHETIALHGLFVPQTPRVADDALPGLKAVCEALDVPLHTADMREVFRREVILPFGRSYADGLTPNPCALCNRQVKFGALLDAALALGAEKMATGHYARLEEAPTPEDSPRLYAAKVTARDQSYFLSLVPAVRLCHALFPLAGRDKPWCATQVARRGLEVPLPSSSRDLCFVKGEGPNALHDHLLSLWESQGETPPGPGPVLLDDGTGKLRQIGLHRGLWRYTEGQRRGMGLPHAEALHVLAKDTGNNALIVGGKSLLGIRACSTGKANFLCDPARWPDRLFARLRYRRKAAPARVEIRDGCLDIFLETEEFPAAPGQLAVIYDARNRVLAGGIIDGTQKSSTH